MTAALLKSLRSLVAYHQSCGVVHYRTSTTLKSCLERLETLRVESTGQTSPVSRGQAAGSGPEAAIIKSAESQGAVVTIEELATEIVACTICPLHQGRKISTPGKGAATRPALLMVGDWLVHDQATGVGTILGEQQEAMLTRMIGAINLDRSQVFITNLIKCSVEASLKPDSTHIEACLSYLKQQIAVLSPRVICTMGAAPAQALLGSSLPLIRLRGRFHQFQLGSGKTIPLMPTFHPSYLFKNEEMKRPTWEDLQAVQKLLQKER
jgi:uracil-DNA glycosylase family 4